MKFKKISLAALILSVCTFVIAAEYKSPTTGVKESSPPGVVSKVAEFNEDYKVEGAEKTDRSIASEKEADREPSSVVATDNKKVDDGKNEDKADPKPWLYKIKIDNVKGQEF